MKNILKKLIVISAFGILLVSYKYVTAECVPWQYFPNTGCGISQYSYDPYLEKNYYEAEPLDDYNNYNSYSYNTQPVYSQYKKVENPTPASPTPIVNNYYYQTVTPKTTTSTSNSTVTKTTSNSSNKVASNNGSTSKTKSEINSENLPSVVKSSNSISDNLPALSLKGKETFMPSSIWQWILVIILILIIIIIARLLSKTHKPTHNVHNVAPAH